MLKIFKIIDKNVYLIFDCFVIWNFNFFVFFGLDNNIFLKVRIGKLIFDL